MSAGRNEHQWTVEEVKEDWKLTSKKKKNPLSGSPIDLQWTLDLLAGKSSSFRDKKATQELMSLLSPPPPTSPTVLHSALQPVFEMSGSLSLWPSIRWKFDDGYPIRRLGLPSVLSIYLSAQQSFSPLVILQTRKGNRTKKAALFVINVNTSTRQFTWNYDTYYFLRHVAAELSKGLVSH